MSIGSGIQVMLTPVRPRTSLRVVGEVNEALQRRDRERRASTSMPGRPAKQPRRFSGLRVWGGEDADGVGDLQGGVGWSFEEIPPAAAAARRHTICSSSTDPGAEAWIRDAGPGPAWRSATARSSLQARRRPAQATRAHERRNGRPVAQCRRPAAELSGPDFCPVRWPGGVRRSSGWVRGVRPGVAWGVARGVAFGLARLAGPGAGRVLWSRCGGGWVPRAALWARAGLVPGRPGRFSVGCGLGGGGSRGGRGRRGRCR
jgi:hypothetical protein